jgi:Fe-S cluster biogenesis protein NfuA
VVDPPLAAIEDKLDAFVRPMLQTHGGDLTLVAVHNGEVVLRFEGACVGCPLRPITLAVTIEPALRSVEGVEAVNVEDVRLPTSVARRVATMLAGASTDSAVRRGGAAVDVAAS